MKVLRAVADDFPQTRIWEPAAQLCGQTCRVLTENGSLIYRDSSHLTASGALYLASHSRFEFFPEGNLQVSQGSH